MEYGSLILRRLSRQIFCLLRDSMTFGITIAVVHLFFEFIKLAEE
jgi:hypothetical protein